MYDLVIIGGGPAGLSAAIEADKHGLKTILIERDNHLGGILHQCIHNGFGLHEFKEELTGPEYAHRLIEQIKETKVEILLNTLMRSLQPGSVECINKDGIHHLSTKSILMCLGCRERTSGDIWLLGERPSGIYMAGAAQAMMNIHGIIPGKKAIIYGSGDIGLIMARRCTLSGMEVSHVFEIAKESSGLERNIQQCLRDFDIPLHLSHAIIHVHGEKKLEGVTVKNLNSGEINYHPCDTLLLSVGLKPLTEHLSELSLQIDPHTKGPLVDSRRMSSVPGIFFCGNNLHVHDVADEVSEEARLAIKGILSWIEDLPLMQGEISPGEGISMVVPQKISFNEINTLYFRVRNTRRNFTIQVKNCDNTSIYTKKISVARPAQIQKIQTSLPCDNKAPYTLEILE